MHKNIKIEYGTNDFIFVYNIENIHNKIAVWKPNMIDKILGNSWQYKVNRAVKQLEEQIKIVEKV